MGEFEQRPNNHLSGMGCQRCAGTNAQNEIVEFIKSLNLHIIFNDRTTIRPYELDIYIPEKLIAIEYNGIYWHSYDRVETPEEKERHKSKLERCIDNNIKLIQINEDEWLNKKDIVKSILKSKIGVLEGVYARKCVTRELSKRQYSIFMSGNHIQGEKGCFVAYGLFYNDELVAAMSFNKHKKYGWEITRFANKLSTTVVGGASKLFKKFIKNHNPNQVLTYADRRYSDGNLYDKLGFRFAGNTPPNYCYIKGHDIYSRQKFMKHKLKYKLEIFDPSLTEAENMFLNGYRRLWDAGHCKFVWESKINKM